MGRDEFDAETEAVLSALEAELVEGADRVRAHQRRHFLAGAVGLVCGLVVVLFGLGIHLIVSAAGFLMMLAGALLAYESLRQLVRMGAWGLPRRLQPGMGRWLEGWQRGR